jgi:hypothetical protein
LGADGERKGEQGRSRRRDQRLREHEQRLLMAIFALSEYAREIAYL